MRHEDPIKIKINHEFQLIIIMVFLKLFLFDNMIDHIFYLII